RAFDWGWLMSAVLSDYEDKALPRIENSVDGGSKGMPRAIFWFRCAAEGRVVTCRNRLGDELRLASGQQQLLARADQRTAQVIAVRDLPDSVARVARVVPDGDRPERVAWFHRVEHGRPCAL